MKKDINFCFLYGKIITDIDFKFFYNSRIHNSIVEFEIEINYEASTRQLKNEIVKVKAYDENADIIYYKYRKGKNIIILGRVNNNCVEIKKICER